MGNEKVEIICPSCAGANAEGAHFCVHCAAPLDSFAATDPLGSIYAQYDTIGKASRSATKPVVLVGMWMLLGPVTCISVGMVSRGLYEIITSGGNSARAMEGALMLVFLVTGIIPAILLIRTTRAFFSGEKKPDRGFQVVGAETPLEDEGDDELTKEAMAAGEEPE